MSRDRARLDADRKATGKTQIVAHHRPNVCCLPGINAISYEVRETPAEGHKRAQGVLDGMNDAQVCATLRALEARFPLDSAETCNGVGIGEWHELLYAEWDRRGGTWKVWEGNPPKPTCAVCGDKDDALSPEGYCEICRQSCPASG